MALTSIAKNTALSALKTTGVKAALFNTSNVELSGGSPAYARKTITWNTPVNGEMRTAGSIVFDIPAGQSVKYIKIYDTGGTNLYDTFTVPDINVETFALQGTYTITQLIWSMNK